MPSYKVVSLFLINQGQASFFPQPHVHRDEERLHTLAVRRALVFYMDRNKPFQSFSQLFMTFSDWMKGCPVSSHRISSDICLCYNLANVTPPNRVLAHSTKAHAASAAFLAQVPILDICKTATWSSVPSFASHYAISQQSGDNAKFGHMVLQSLLK